MKRLSILINTENPVKQMRESLFFEQKAKTKRKPRVHFQKSPRNKAKPTKKDWGPWDKALDGRKIRTPQFPRYSPSARINPIPASLNLKKVRSSTFSKENAPSFFSSKKPKIRVNGVPHANLKDQDFLIDEDLQIKIINYLNLIFEQKGEGRFMQEMEYLLLMVGERSEEAFKLQAKFKKEDELKKDPLHIELEKGALSAYGAPISRGLRTQSENVSLKENIQGEISGIELSENLKEQEKIISRVRKNFNQG